MRSMPRWLMLAAVAGSCMVAWNVLRGQGMTRAQERAAIRVTRIYSGADGQSHAEDVDPKLGAPNALGMEQSAELKAGSVNFVRFPTHFFEDWHQAHARRYVITLSGRGEIELGGGQKIPMEPGRIVLVEDTTGKGHMSRALTADWTAVFVQLDQ